jgi:NADH:ubiquinone reductase (H+-translocating)
MSLSKSSNTIPHVVIVGAGFGGLAAAKGLGNSQVNITVIDKTNHHLFQPLLYQVATAGLAAPSIAAPIRHILREQSNTTVLLGEVTGIDLKLNRITLDHQDTLDYDFLIVATGATHSYFGHDDWAQFAPGLKTLNDAHLIRGRALQAFESAERLSDHDKQADCLRFVVIGGGPTGVEMAGTFAEIARHTLKGEFRNFKAHSAEIILVEGATRILSAYSEPLSQSAKEQLESLGVKVMLNTKVTAIDASGISADTPTGPITIRTQNIVWGAGVKASPIGKLLASAAGLEVDRVGRVAVQADLTLAGFNKVSVIGDLAAVSCQGAPVPGIAPAAKQMGQYAARYIQAQLLQKTPAAFMYKDYGSMATIGRHRAIAKVGRWQFKGFIAWFLWLVTHIVFLIGFRNRMVVLTDWATQYTSMQRHARIFSSKDNSP